MLQGATYCNHISISENRWYFCSYVLLNSLPDSQDTIHRWNELLKLERNNLCHQYIFFTVGHVCHLPSQTSQHKNKMACDAGQPYPDHDRVIDGIPKTLCILGIYIYQGTKHIIIFSRWSTCIANLLPRDFCCSWSLL